VPGGPVEPLGELGHPASGFARIVTAGRLPDLPSPYLEEAICEAIGWTVARVAENRAKINEIIEALPAGLTDAEIFNACYRELLRRW